MMTSDEWKAKIREYFAGGHDYVSFAELLLRYDSENARSPKEQVVLHAPNRPDLVLWAGDVAFIDAIIDLLQKEKFLTVEVCSWLCYMVDGMALKLPIAKNVRKSKKERWLPVVLRTWEAVNRSEKKRKAKP